MGEKLTKEQAAQLPLFLHNILFEIRNFSGTQQAAADLAYAAHNLPFMATSDRFDLQEIRYLFQRFHDDHGYHVFDFVDLLDTMERGESIKDMAFNTPRNRGMSSDETHDSKEA